MNSTKEKRDHFEEYASNYLGRQIKVYWIKDGGEIVPKLDELTNDVNQFGHLLAFYENLLNQQGL